MCQRCGEEANFPAECRETRNTPAPAALHSPYPAPSPEVHAAQYGSRESFNDWKGRGCHKFVPVPGGDGAKIAPTGDYLTNPLVK